jgi:predicted dehydrogenase
VNEGRKVRAGVIGVGSLGFHHARLLRDVAGAEMIGIHDTDAARAAAVADQLGIHAFSELEDLLSRVDAAVIAVPTTFHAPVALAALDHGVHLLIEKPFASTLEEADEIVDRAQETGLLVATGHVERFNSVLAACEAYLSEPRFIESHRLAPFNPRGTDVAVVLDLMIHDIDLVLSLAGRPAESVNAVGVPVLTPNIDIANARLVFEGGAVANITASRVSRERMRKIRFFQASGYISLDLAAGTGEFLRLREGVRPGVFEAAPPALEEIVERIEISGDGVEPLRRELDAFIAAVRGEREVVVSGRDGRRALGVALQIIQSIHEYVADPRPA